MPLVSVIISTYNSSAFIVETLDSISRQSWKDIELIITDDCSADNTVSICNQWIGDHRSRFSGVQVITSEVNTGVSANANRGLRAARGEWVKFLGSDDTLLPDCLADNMHYISLDPGIRVLFSRIDIYNNDFSRGNYLATTPSGPITEESILWPGRSAGSQYRMLLVADRMHFSPSVFMYRDLIISLGGFDERFRLLEDYPLWLTVTKNGHRLYFMDRITVNYRRHPLAINNTGRPFLVNPNYFRAEPFRRLYTYPYLPLLVRSEQKFIWTVSQVFRNERLNRSTALTRFLFATVTIYLNPFRYMVKLGKVLRNDIMKSEFYS
jgi:alpha-1,3-rhamnosyltransferase